MENEVIKTKADAILCKDDYIEKFMEGFMKGFLQAQIEICLRVFLIQFAEATGKHKCRAKSFWAETVEEANKESAIRGVIDSGLQSLIEKGKVSRKEVQDKYKTKEFYYAMACKYDEIKKDLCEEYIEKVNPAFDKFVHSVCGNA